MLMNSPNPDPCSSGMDSMNALFDRILKESPAGGSSLMHQYTSRGGATNSPLAHAGHEAAVEVIIV